MFSNKSSSHRSLIYIIILFLISIVFVGCNPSVDQGGEPITLDQAAQLVLTEFIKPDQLEHEVIVFSWPELLTPDDLLQSYVGSNLDYPGGAFPFEDDTWFFWVDDAPGALFAHPTRYAFVDRNTGEASIYGEEWWPLLNGESLWTDTPTYWDENNWVFSNVDWLPSSLDGADDQPEPIPPPISEEDKSGVALVVNGWSEGQTLKEDLQANAGAMIGNLFLSGFDTTYIGTLNATGRNQRIIDWLLVQSMDLVPGQTALIYITAHGSETDQRGKVKLGDEWLEEGLFAEYLKWFDPGVHVIVIMDACYSGSWVDGIREVADLVVTSTGAQDLGWGDWDPTTAPFDPNPDDVGTEYSSGLAEDWNEIWADPAQMELVRERVKRTGENFWVALTVMSHLSALEKDITYIRGFTFPNIVHGFSPSPQPTATPTQSPENKAWLTFAALLSGDFTHFTSNSMVKGKVTVLGKDPVPMPDATVTMRMTFPNGSSETLTAVTGADGVAEVGFNIYVYGTYTIYLENIEGENMQYAPELNSASSVIVVVKAGEGKPVIGMDSILAFYTAFNTAFVDQDTETLMNLLHPAVLDVYSESVCRDYLNTVISNTIQVEPLVVTGFGLWDWLIDEVTTPIENTYTIEVKYTLQDGSNLVQATHLALHPDGTLGWFTDCGDPLP